MRITILTVGSRGDVQPLLAFGLGLASAGHEVRFATHAKFEPAVAAAGLEFAPLAEGRVSEGTSTAEGRWWLERGSRRLPPWVALLMDARSVAGRRLADALAACAGAEAIVASELATLLGWQMSERYDVPLVRARLSPPAAAARRPLFAALRQLAWIATRPALNSMRRTLELPPLPWREPIGSLQERGVLTLYGFSAAVAPETLRLESGARVTGYWFLDHDADPEPQPQLLEFLAAGPAPVCVGFGSMLDADPRAMCELIVGALRAAGQRGVLVGGQVAASQTILPDGVLAVEAVSHGWLLERCAAVVHHGGAGTVAAALRAGVPSVAVPHMIDQYTWGRRIHELGVGPPPLPRRKLSLERLREAIVAAACNPRMGERAAALGERIRRENGVANAVQAFEQHLGRAVDAPLSGVTNG
jgi:UDP:flavonoid glycosyltransferase YjiC (YdhE family)